MDSPRNQFLTCSCFAQDQDGRISFGNRAHLLEDLNEFRTFANDFIEILVPDFIFEIELFFGKPFFQVFDFFVGERVRHPNCHLGGKRNEQFHIFFGDRILPLAHDFEGSEGFVSDEQRQDGARLKPFALHHFKNISGSSTCFSVSIRNGFRVVRTVPNTVPLTGIVMPSRRIPRSANIARDAASDVIFLTASSSVKRCSSRT